MRYAESEWTAACMDKAGFPQLASFPAPRLRHAFPELRITLESFGPSTKQQALELGYGSRPQPQPPAVMGNDQSFDHALDGCRQRFWSSLGSDARRTHDIYFELGNQLNAAFSSRHWNEDVKALYRPWLDCMDKAGFPVADREQFLADREWEHFDIELGTEEYVDDVPEPSGEPGVIEVIEFPEQRYEPTREEVRMAVADVGCRQDTGFNEAIMPLVIQTQRSIIADREEQFRELNPKLERLAKQAADMVDS